jgi:hypothetical protein
MENRLKHLNRLMDKEMSRTPVFKENDEHNILAAIKNTTPEKKVKPKNQMFPRLLTAALFAGIIFTSYTVFNNYLTPDTATEVKKPETRYAQEFTQASSQLSYDVNTRELTIKGMVKNTTDFNSEPFQAKVNILSEELASSLGTKSLALDVTLNNVLQPDELYSFEKIVSLDLEIVNENTFKNAVQVEVYSKTKTLTSFVIDNISFKEVSVDQPVENEEPADQQPPSPEESIPSTDDQMTEEKEKEKQTAKESLAELEEKYGKKRTPFKNIDVISKNGYFYMNGITIDNTMEESLQMLGPYDNYYDTGYHSSINGVWEIESSLDHSYLDLEFNQSGKEGKVIHITYNTLDKAYVEEWMSKLGTPFLEKPTGSKFFYHEKSKQMLIVSDWGDYMSIILQYETNLDLYKK